MSDWPVLTTSTQVQYLDDLIDVELTIIQPSDEENEDLYRTAYLSVAVTGNGDDGAARVRITSKGIGGQGVNTFISRVAGLLDELNLITY